LPFLLLQLQNISLYQFKNYQDKRFGFNERIVAICGKNGVGKTNLLDAIYYLCFTKSYFTRTDSQNVLHDAEGFRLEGSFASAAGHNTVVCVLRETGRKEFQVNGEAYTRFSAHIGRYPAVIIAPDDVHIITGGSEERRRFLDALISQLDQEYLQHLISYNKILQQRNSLLKSFAETRSVDDALLEVLNSQLTGSGNVVFEKRRLFMNDFIPVVKDFYGRISAESYEVELTYQSQLLDCSFDQLLSRWKEKDLMLQRTSAGIHRDEIDIQLNGQAFKNIASQGQRKSLLFALKFAEFEVLRQQKSFPPILLLDDIFEKLDQTRMQNLLEWVCRQNEGQIFITDTHCNRLQEHLNGLQVAYQLIEL
jgi:DNA replication and repair protein RecF